MNIAFVPGSNGLDDYIFDKKGKCNEDNRVSKWIKLKEVLELDGHVVHTIDKFNPKDVDLIIILFNFVFGLRYYLDVIKKNPNVIIIYQMFEPELGEPLNNKKIMEKWDMFDRIYTYRDDYVDNINFFKLSMHNYGDINKIESCPFKDKSFLCIINSLRQPRYPKNKIVGFSLYEERIKVVTFFSRNKEIDIYGPYWDKKGVSETIISCYKGVVKNKKTVLKKYKFAICFENEGGVPGYISEKILDCFEAGVIPIYCGASNIDKYFPPNTYIDYRDFKDLNKLNSFLKSIDEKTYINYIQNIESFIKSDNYYLFTEKGFIDRIYGDVNELIKVKCEKSFLKIKFQLLRTLIQHPYISYNEKKKGYLFYSLTKW